MAPPSRPKSQLGHIDASPSLSRLPTPTGSSSATRSTTPAPRPSSRIKAPLTLGSIPANTSAKNPILRPTSRPSSPRKRPVTPGPTSGVQSRATTPLPMTPDAGDPEEGLLDWKVVAIDPDASMELDDDHEHAPPAAGSGGTPADKVFVSVRVKPGAEDRDSAWIVEPHENLIKLDPKHARSTGKLIEHRFDALLTGSDNKAVYNRAARAHVKSAMEGYNSVVFAYGQTASGKTFTLMGDEDEPGIIPRAMKDVFTFIRKTPTREYLLRCSYLEIYNEQIYDLLAPSSSGSGPTITDAGITNLREEVVTSLKGIKAVMEKGDGSRRTASTDWNERSSRSHSVFRLVIESREVGDDDGSGVNSVGGPPPTPGGTRLQTRGGRSVQSSVLSLIDLAGSEKATSDKERTREGKYINTSLLTLGTVIGTLAENASRGKSDYVPYRNSKLTRLLQPSLSGNAKVSVICTLNSAPGAIGETTSTLGFASRVKRVHLHAVKKEVIDTDALLERYRKEIEELKARLHEREREAPVRARRLSAKQQVDETRALTDMSGRIAQLTKLILTSETVHETKGDQSRPSSPSKLDFINLSPLELQRELLLAKEKIDQQATHILSLEASLDQRAVIPLDAPEYEKDAKIGELQRQVNDYELVTKRYKENLGEPLRAVKEDVEREWKARMKVLEEKVRTAEAYSAVCEKALEKEQQIRVKLEDEKRALVSFVSELDSHLPSLRGLAPPLHMSPHSSSPSFRSRLAPLAETDSNSLPPSPSYQLVSPSKRKRVSSVTLTDEEADHMMASLLDQTPDELMLDDDTSFTSQTDEIDDKENAI